MILLPIRFLLFVCGLAASTAFAQKTNGKIYAAVLFNNSKSNVTGADRYVGVFTRKENSPAWKNFSNTNLFAFGLGFAQYGATKHYYLAGGNGLHHSADGGKSWKILTGWETMEILAVALAPADSATIYVATPDGIFKSFDAGKSWSRKMRGFKTWYVQQVIIDRRDQHALYAAAEDDLYRSPDGGEHWSPLHVGVLGMRTVLQHPTAANNMILAGTEDHGVRVTWDGGKNWQAGIGIPATAIYAIQAAADGRAIYAAGYKTGVWRSVDQGRTWRQIWAAPEIEAIYSLFVDPTDGDHLMAGTNGKGIYESTDHGQTWNAAGLDGAHVKQISRFP